ncbi:MAG: MarC family protein [Actinomycetia bacterium]|nr:MarC family protein [Actinomycetes bacterium]MCH9801634.1 MarC family protein [Actinomycetes bacterium]
MDAALFGSVFVTLFVIMDPIGIIPVFLGAVGNRPQREVRRLAWQAALTSLLLITVFAIFGDWILDYLNISLPALRVAGGLLLLLVALRLLTSGEVAKVDADDAANVALVPLGTPLLAGPGAIVAAILFVRSADQTADYLAITLGIVAIHLVIWLSLRFSTGILRVLRPAGVTVLSRIAGMLLAAIAVQLIADGVHEFILEWQE